MRIEEIHVDGFGLMRDRSLRPDPGLTVFRGLNEAGKTTLLAFIRAMLFGFDTRSYPAVAGGRRGGWLDVRTVDDQSFRIERYGDAGGQGRVRVLDGQGQDLGPGELAVLLQGVEPKLYRNVFAFGLDELAQFEHLRDPEVAARIYGAGLGLGAISALDVERALGADRERLFRPGGQNPQVNGLLAKLDAVDAKLHGLDLPARYGEAVGELHRHDARLVELAADLRHANEGRGRMERLRNAWKPWLRLRAATARGAALGPDASADAVLGRRADIEDLARASERDRAAEKELVGVRRELDGLGRERDDALRRLGRGWTAERVAAFDDSVAVQNEITGRFRGRLDGAAAELVQARTALDQLARDLAAARSEAERVEAAVAGIVELEAAETALPEQERRLREIDAAVAARDWARDRTRAAGAALEAAGVELHAADHALAAVPTGQAEPHRSPAAIAEAGRLGRALRDAVGERAQVVALLASLASPPTSTASPPTSTASPPTSTAGTSPARGPVVPVAIALAGAVAGLAAILLGLPPLVGIMVAAIGVAVAAGTWFAAGIARGPLDGRGHSTSTTTATDTAARLIARRDELGTASAGLAATLGLAGGLGPAADIGPIADLALADVDAFLARLDEVARALERVAALGATAAEERREQARVEASLGVLAEAAGCPASPSEANLAGLRTSLSTARDRRSTRLGLEEQLTALRRRIEVLDAQSESAGRRAEQARLDDGRARDEWAAWLVARDLDPAFDRETARTVIDAISAAKRPLRSLAGLEQRAVELAGQRRAFVGTVTALASSLGLEVSVDPSSGEPPSVDPSSIDSAPLDRSALDRLLADLEDALARTVEVDREIAECRGTLAMLSGPGPALESLMAELEAVPDVSAIQSSLGEIAGQLREREAEQARLREGAGALRKSIDDMEREVAATADRQLRADLLAQLEARAEEWATVAIARHVLGQARSAYEAAHRPAVVEVAERLFEEWTGGRYRRILAPLGGQLEEVELRDGRRVRIANLSTGTAQQLYLALRFGLVERFGQTAEPLPIVMDDILVNFDDERAALTARSIERLAGRQQVLYFTCHPSVPLQAGIEVHLDRLEVARDTVAWRP